MISKLKLGDEDCKLFGGLRRCIGGDKLIELVLRPILDAGHGGAVLVIPSRNAPWLQESLSPLKEVAELNLTHRAVEHLSACVEYHRPADATQRIKRWLQTRGRLAIAARTTGELASVDGCVVLDRALSVVGFGAKINVSREAAENSPIQFQNAKTNTPVLLSELEKIGGTRFRSALWVCKQYPHVVAFVVSQDQEMKVLWFEDKVAFAFGPIALSTVPQFA